MDGWVAGGGADTRYSDTNGVTLGKYSLDVYVPTGAWATVLSLNLLDPNQAAVLAAFRSNTKITADITHLVRDWPVGKIPPWNGTHLIINTDAGYMDLGYRAGWSQNDGDRTDSVTWDYGQQLSRIDFSKVTYLELMIVVNANSADYTGWVWFYLDNMKFSGGGIVLNPKPATGAKDVDVNTQLSWSAGVSCEHARPVPGHVAGGGERRQRRQRSERDLRPARRDQLRSQQPGVQHAVLLASGRRQRRQSGQPVEGRRLGLHHGQFHHRG